MKILLITSHLNAGGITSYTLSLATALKERGCEVFLASGGGTFEEGLDLPHINIGIHTKNEIGFKTFSGAFKLKKFIQEKKIDLIHAQTRVAAVTSFFATRGTRIPFITTAHGFFRPHLGRRFFPCWGDRTIAISSHVLAHLKKDFHLPSSRIHLIYNGTDLSRYEKHISETRKQELIQKWNLDSTAPLIGIIARLSPVKGHHYLLTAIAELKKEFKNLQCLVVGDGPSQQQFLEEKKKLELNGALRWIPWLNDPVEALSLLNIFVLPSLQEGLSLSILEAQAMGIPVVASDVGGISEVVVHEKTGFLVPPKDSIALKNAIKTLLLNPSLAQEMGQAGKKRIQSHFSLSKMADQVVEVYQSACTSKSAARIARALL